jgi:hypothetical protein
MRRAAPPIAPLVLIAFVASLATGLPGRASAQTEPPHVAGDAPAAVAPEPPPSVAAPAAPVPAPSSSPAPASSSSSSSSSATTLTPVPPAEPAPTAPVSLAVEPGALPPLPPEERVPMYKQPWFWAIVGVVALTAVMITIGVATQGPKTPGTDLGNMRAY